jgi:ribose transport system ATP-binding protein
MSAALLEIRGLTKDFPGQRALDGVDLDVGRGEIVALAGANGSGKSTLVKVLAGFHEPDAGTISGVADRHFIHQDLSLIPTLSAAENIALASGFQTTRAGRISWRRQRARAQAAIARFGAAFDVSTPVAELTPAERTIVAIARALDGWEGADALLVLDEPTASLHEDEVTKLFAATRGVAEAGAGVLFISHRIPEVLALANRVVVLRDGRVAGTPDVAGLTSDDLVELIVGRRVEDLYTEAPPPRDDVALSVRGLSGTRIRELSFDLHRGEILGVSGLDGSGREELATLLYGGRSPAAGTVTVGGEPLRRGSVRDAMRHGVAFVPADRARQAAVMTHSVRENVALSDLASLRRHGRIDRGRERREVAGWMDRLDLRPRNQDMPLTQLSGGNQQKAVLAKWLRIAPTVILLDEPTQGVDVGAKAAIYRHLADAAAHGAALLVCSNEAKDLAAVCDRVIVLRDGEVASVLGDRTLTEERIISDTVGLAGHRET